jgi:broad specificity phosphatase PhoE
MRHTERFITGLGAPNMEDVVLTEFGRNNASELRDFIEFKGFDIQTIFVTQRTYSYEVAVPFAQASATPLISYDLGISNATHANFDMRRKLDNLDPCTHTIQVVSHGF